MQNEGILHYPRLDTVLMVEKAIRNSEDYPTKFQLSRALPKSVMYQTLEIILEYLEESGKIVIKDGKIIWIWNPELVRKLDREAREALIEKRAQVAIERAMAPGVREHLAAMDLDILNYEMYGHNY